MITAGGSFGRIEFERKWEPIGGRSMIHERGWECFASYHDELAAGVVADYLCQVMGKRGAQLNDGVRVFVPGQLLHRAKWLWAQADLSEGELQFLISGELPGV
jgi:hypothetical protein